MWKTVKLGDVIDYVKRNAQGSKLPYVGLENITTQTMRLEGAIEVPLNTSTTFAFDETHVLYGRLRPYLKKVFLPTFKGQCSTEIFVIDVKAGLLREYLAYWLIAPSVANAIEKTSTGARMPRANMNALLDFDFSLPPLAEQQRIVEKLDRAFAEIDEAVLLTSKNIEDSKRVYEYAIDTIFEKQSERRKRIGEFSSISYGFTTSASAIGSYKFLRITDIQNNFVNWDNVPYCDVEEKKVSQFLLQDGDIVFARTGATTGKSFLVKNPLNSVFASYLIRLSVNREMLNPNYVMHFFQSTAYWRQVNEGLTGAAQGGFNASKLGNLLIPILEMNKQQEIVEKLDSIYTHTNELGLLYNRKNVQLNSLKSSILKQALQPPQQ